MMTPAEAETFANLKRYGPLLEIVDLFILLLCLVLAKNNDVFDGLWLLLLLVTVWLLWLMSFSLTHRGSAKAKGPCHIFNCLLIVSIYSFFLVVALPSDTAIVVSVIRFLFLGVRSYCYRRDVREGMSCEAMRVALEAGLVYILTEQILQEEGRRGPCGSNNASETDEPPPSYASIVSSSRPGILQDNELPPAYSEVCEA